MTARRGFTLIELVVAMAIFAVLAALAYGALSSVLATRKHVESKTTALAALQKAMAALERDVEQAAPRDVRDEFGDKVPALQGGSGAGAVQFALTRAGWRNPLARARSTLQRVEYGVRDGHLIRRAYTVLDRVQNSVVYEEALLDGVSVLEVRFLDQGKEWQGFWPPPNAGQPAKTPWPRAIEVNVDVKGFGRITRLFHVPEGVS